MAGVGGRLRGVGGLDRRRLGRLDQFTQRFGDWRQLHLPVTALASFRPSQQGGEGQVDHHHRADMAVKTPRAIYLAVVDAPEDFQPTVDALTRGASVVKAFELFRRAGNTRKTAQVNLLLDAHGQTIFAFAVASRIAGAIEAVMTRRAAILERATLRLVTDVR